MKDVFFSTLLDQSWNQGGTKERETKERRERKDEWVKKSLSGKLKRPKGGIFRSQRVVCTLYTKAAGGLATPEGTLPHQP